MATKKSAAAVDDIRPRAEAEQMTRRVMKVMLESAPAPHDKVQRRAKRERRKVAALARREGKAKR